MVDKKVPNRWLIALAAVVMQMCLGAVYAWSVFTKPLIAIGSWSVTEVSGAFPCAMMFLGIGSVIGGRWQDRKGPRVVSTAAGILYGCGLIIAALGAAVHSLPVIYIGYGLFSGLGMGIGYVCPVATLIKWFPDRRGLMTGIAVMGFGAGAFVMGPVAARMIIEVGVPQTFLTFGIAYLILVVAAAQTYSVPAQGWRPAGWEPTAVSQTASKVQFTAMQALKTQPFWLLWLMLTLNTSAGIMIMSQASPLAQQQAGVTAVAASTIVGLLSVCNALGRVFWSWVSDHLGRAQVFFMLFAIQVILFFALPGIHQAVLFTLVTCAIALCYGAGYGVTPAWAADVFGPKYVGEIFGWILLGWGFFAVIPTPLLIAYLRQTTGSYESAIHLAVLMMLISLAFPLLARRAVKRMSAASGAEAGKAKVAAI